MKIISVEIMRKNKFEGKTAALHSAPCHTEPLRKFAFKWWRYLKNLQKISIISFIINVHELPLSLLIITI